MNNQLELVTREVAVDQKSYRLNAAVLNIEEVAEIDTLILALAKAENGEAAFIIESTRTRVIEILDEVGKEMLEAGESYALDQLGQPAGVEKVQEAKKVIATVQAALHKHAYGYFEVANKLAERIPASVLGEKLRSDLLAYLGNVEEESPKNGKKVPKKNVGKVGRFGVVKEEVTSTDAGTVEQADADLAFRRFASRVVRDLSERNHQQLLLDVLTLPDSPEGIATRKADVQKLVDYSTRRLGIKDDNTKVVAFVEKFLQEIRDGQRPNPYFVDAGSYALAGTLPVTIPADVAQDKDYKPGLKTWLEKDLQPMSSLAIEGTDPVGIQSRGPGINRAANSFRGHVKAYRGNGMAKELRADMQAATVETATNPSDFEKVLSEEKNKNITDGFAGLYAYDADEIKNAIVTLPVNGKMELHMRLIKGETECILKRDAAGNLKITDMNGGRPGIFRELRDFEKAVARDPMSYFLAPGKLVFPGQSAGK